jgi:transformation/transcription domain-associated protein
MEIRQGQNREVGVRPMPSTLLTCFLDAIPHALSRENPKQAESAQDLLARIVQDLMSMCGERNVSSQDVLFILHQIANRFNALCLDDPWVRKRAGCRGVEIMTRTPDLGVRWITDRDVDLVRTLLHVLKDLPYDLPRDVEGVIDVLINVLRTSNADLNFQTDTANHVRSKLFHLVGILFPELQSSNLVVRQAVHRCIEELVTLSNRSAVELLTPHRDRILAGIYSKPLRALPYPKQIGIIEAVRYCLTLDPPLIELNDEFLRLSHEVLALADAEDASLVGRGNVHQHAAEVTRLRVACIKLLTASMPLTDFFSRQHQTRQRYEDDISALDSF